MPTNPKVNPNLHDSNNSYTDPRSQIAKAEQISISPILELICAECRDR